VTGLRVTGDSDALRPLALSEGHSKGSGASGARSGTIATRHPQADPGHDPGPLKHPTQKTNGSQPRVLGYRSVDWYILNVSGPLLLAFAPVALERNDRGYFYFRLEHPPGQAEAHRHGHHKNTSDYRPAQWMKNVQGAPH